MKTRLLGLITLLILLAGLFPATAVFADSGDDGDYEFKGIVESLPDSSLIGDWVVSGTTVQVTDATQIETGSGDVAVGVCVKVKGWLQSDGSVDATKIETKEPLECSGGDDGDGDEAELHGTIDSLPGTPNWVGEWVVSGTTVHVDVTTQIDTEHGAVAVGAFVEVKGVRQGDGSINATEIEIKASPIDDGSGGGEAEFYGTIESLPASGLIGDWQVSGVTVHVTTTTQIEQEHGLVAVGAYVEVKGTRRPEDGSIDATKVEVKMGAGGAGEGNYTKFYGTIEALPDTSGWIGKWTVDGRTVNVDALTRIEQEHGLVQLGAYVEVKGWSQSDGSVNAVKIEVKASPTAGTQTKFHGIIESLPMDGLIGDWVVSGTTVHVDASTRIEQEDGPAVVGAFIEVKGWLQTDGSVNATKIEVNESPDEGEIGTSIEFYGVVEQLPADGLIGTWMISGRVTTVTATTEIDQEHGPVEVGAYVKVEGVLQADGGVIATEIEVRSSPSTGGGGNVGYIKFYGLVEDIQPATDPNFLADWLVGGRTVHVSATTVIEEEHGTAGIGAFVEVKGIQQADGSVNATKIEVKDTRS